MTWATRFRRRESARQSLWLVPLVGALAGALVAWGVESVGDSFEMPAALTFTPSTASSLLSAILGAMIGLIGFVVTVTVLLVQTATGQFSARYMRLLYRDPLLKAVLAALLGNFAYSFVLLRRVGESEAPDLGLIILGGLVLLGVVLFLAFLSHILRRLRPAAVASAVADLGIRAFLGLARSAQAITATSEVVDGGVHTVSSRNSGSIQAVHLEGCWPGRGGTRARSSSGTGWATSSTSARHCSRSGDRPHPRARTPRWRGWWRWAASAPSTRTPPSRCGCWWTSPTAPSPPR